MRTKKGEASEKRKPLLYDCIFITLKFLYKKKMSCAILKQKECFVKCALKQEDRLRNGEVCPYTIKYYLIESIRTSGDRQFRRLTA